jgi:hypothetical protein
MMADKKEQRVCVKFCFLLGTVRNLTAMITSIKCELNTMHGINKSNWRIILKWIFRKWDVGGIDWNDLDQNMDR